MGNKWQRFLAFFGLNIVAAYVPSACWVFGLPGTQSVAFVFLVSPVVCPILAFDINNSAVGWCFLGGFLLLVAMLSATFFRFKNAWIVVPSIIAAYSLLQGLLVAVFVRGLTGVARS
jgi:hypothetical protein